MLQIYATMFLPSLYRRQYYSFENKGSYTEAWIIIGAVFGGLLLLIATVAILSHIFDPPPPGNRSSSSRSHINSTPVPLPRIHRLSPTGEQDLIYPFSIQHIEEQDLHLMALLVALPSDLHSPDIHAIAFLPMRHE